MVQFYCLCRWAKDHIIGHKLKSLPPYHYLQSLEVGMDSLEVGMDHIQVLEGGKPPPQPFRPTPDVGVPFVCYDYHNE